MDIETICLSSGTKFHIYKSTNKQNYLLICHGFGGTEILYKQYDKLFDFLLNKYSIITFSFTGCSIPQYNSIEIDDIMIWIDDINYIVNYIININKSAEISLFGISMGAFVSTIYATLNTFVKANICIGGVLSLNMSMKLSNGIAFQYLKESGEPELNGIKVNRKFLSSLIRNQPYIYFTNEAYKTATLLLVGENDNIFRKTDAEIAEHLLNQRGVFVKKEIIKNGRHFINNYEAIENCLQVFADWEKIVRIE